MKSFLFVLVFILESLVTHGQTLIPFRKDSLWGFSNLKKEIIIPCQYFWVSTFKDGLADVSKGHKNNGPHGFIDTTGKIVVPIKYHIVGVPSENTIRVYSNDSGNWGYVDYDGNEILPQIYDKAQDFEYNRMLVVYKNEYQMIDKNGKIYFRNQDVFGSSISEGFLTFRKNNKEGIIDTLGNIILKPMTCQDIHSARESKFAILNKDIKWGFLDKSGVLVIPCIYEKISLFSEGLACVYNKKWHVINHAGKTVFETNFNELDYFSEGLCAFRKGKKWGFIDKTGKIIIKPQFEGVKEFSDGLAAVFINGKWGFIDKKGNIVIDPIYFNVESFENGIAYVKKYDKTEKSSGYIDKFANQYWEDNEK